MSVIVTGSIATDYLMKYPGQFREHIFPEQTGKLSVSFLVEEKQMSRGGCRPEHRLLAWRCWANARA